MNRKTFLRSIAGGAAAAPFAASCRTKPSALTATTVRTRDVELTERFFEHMGGADFMAGVYIGDRLGLFKTMAGRGPLGGRELAARAGLSERYVLEWLRLMATSGYIDYDPAHETFTLPPEHAAVLADEDSPSFLAGLAEGTIPDMLMIPRVVSSFRTGKGISYGEFPPRHSTGSSAARGPITSIC